MKLVTCTYEYEIFSTFCFQTKHYSLNIKGQMLDIQISYIRQKAHPHTIGRIKFKCTVWAVPVHS